MSRIVHLNEGDLCGPRDRRARGVEEPVLEIELSPQELLDLTQRPASVQLPASSAAVRSSIASGAQTPGDTPSTDSPGSPQLPASQFAIGTGVAAAVAITAILLLHGTPTSTQTAALATEALPITTPLGEPAMPTRAAPSVKFSNPFDRSEVFEFPAGTSRAEAHARVAEILTKRAQERKALYQRVATTHRSRVAVR